MAGKVRKSGFGSIEKRDNGNFRAGFINPRYELDNNEPKRITRTFDRKTDATAWLAQQKADIDRGIWLSPIQEQAAVEKARQEQAKRLRTFADYAQEWFTFKTHLKDSSLRRYRSSYRLYLEPRWGDTPLTHITKQDVKTWVASSFAKEYKGTAKNAFELFRAILRAAYEDELIDRIPITSDMTRVLNQAAATSKRRRTSRALEDWELALLIDGKDTVDENGQVTHVEGLPPQYRFLTLFMAVTGLRIGEALALRRCDLDLDAGTIAIRRQLTAYKKITSPKTKSSAATLQLSPEFIDRIRDHLAALPVKGSESLVFPGLSGDFITDDDYRESIERACNRLEIKRFTPHDLRRTMVTNLGRAGVPLKDMQAMSRHATASMILRYAQTNTEHQREAARIAYNAVNTQETSNVLPLKRAR